MATIPTTPVTTTKEVTQSERFQSMVIAEFNKVANGVEITDFQKKLCRSYFIKLSQTLENAEINRLKKSEKSRDPLAVTWDNIDLNKLAIDVMSFCKVGLDPTLANQVSLIPYKNNSRGKYDIVFMIGYKGCEIKAKKYGLEIPTDVIVEVVYETDIFKQIKRDFKNEVEGYKFEVTNDFNRGKIIGGFYYLKYADPTKNKLRVFNMNDINKRKPKHASTEFWGGEKAITAWDKNQNKYVLTGEIEVVEGWLDEMVYKTLYRAAYDSITIDSQKIDDALVQVIEKDKEAMYGNDAEAEIITKEAKAEQKTEAKRNTNTIGFDAPIEIKTEPKAEETPPVEVQPTPEEIKPTIEAEF